MFEPFPNKSGYCVIHVSGADAIDFAHRMFSRDFKRLETNRGVLSLFLTAEGKMKEIFWAIKTPEGLILIVRSDRQTSLINLIEQYHFSEKFTVQSRDPIAASWANAPSSASADFPEGEGILEGSVFKGRWKKTNFEFHLDKTPTHGDVAKWELHRIRCHIPEHDKDFDESTLVFDVGLDTLCDANKGCYIGQEVVERVRSRMGHGPRKFVLFSFAAKVPPLATVEDEAGAPIGSISHSIIGDGKEFLALGFVRATHAKRELKVAEHASKIPGKINEV